MSNLRHFIQENMQYASLIEELVSRDIKLKYRRSFLGYIWSILNPLLVMLVMTLVFSAMFKRNIEYYPVYLLIGRSTYEFMTTSTNAAMGSVTGNAQLLKKTYIPRYIFTLSKVTSAAVDFLFSLGALLIVILVTRVPFCPTMLFLPVVLIQLYIFCLGLGFLLAELHVFFRDVKYIYKAVTTAWMYLTPIFYPVENLPQIVQVVIKGFNPMYYYVAQFRDLFLHKQLPGPRIFWGGWIIAIAMFLFGAHMFRRSQNRFILYI